jgi:ribosomal protein L37AE/L43A
VRQALEAILDKSCGTQLSIRSMKVVWFCPDCDAGLLAGHLESKVALRPDALPVAPR